jgi:hypothetical protein
MRADLGFILIALGLGGVYLVLSGKFPPQGPPPQQQPTTQNTKTGSTGMSYQTAIRFHRVSSGGMR